MEGCFLGLPALASLSSAALLSSAGSKSSSCASVSSTFARGSAFFRAARTAPGRTDMFNPGHKDAQGVIEFHLDSHLTGNCFDGETPFGGFKIFAEQISQSFGGNGKGVVFFIPCDCKFQI